MTETAVAQAPDDGLGGIAISTDVRAPRVRRVRRRVVRPKGLRPRVIRRRPGAAGLVFATLFFCLSLTP
ncbi:MAG: hypothetical protein JWR88_1072, partial [Pseudonocardia sp.]|nr:hypothetical protein [Pseudonocardia sp.]